jgi:hypothetical protein
MDIVEDHLMQKMWKAQGLGQWAQTQYNNHPNQASGDARAFEALARGYRNAASTYKRILGEYRAANALVDDLSSGSGDDPRASA